MIQYSLSAVLSWALLLPSLFLAGYRFQFLIEIKNELLKGIFFYALGMAVFSYSVILLSAFHILNSYFIWSILILFLISQIRIIPIWFAWLKATVLDLMPGKSFFERTCSVIFVFAFFALLAGSFSPELGGDALCYQLNLPKIFLAKGSVIPIYYDINSYFPLFMNNLYLIGFATGGILSAKLFHFLTGILLFLALKIKIHDETKSRALAYFLALVFLLTPVVYNMLSTSYVDVGLALYIFLAFITLQNAVQSSNAKSFFLSGLLLGCAVSIKYLGLISALALGLVFVFELYSSSVANKFKKFMIWVSGFVLGFGYWVVRNWYLTGNPLYPYLGSIFKTEPIPGMKYDQVGVGYSFFHLLSVFWNMVMQPTAFGTFSDRIGMFYLLLIPFILLGAIFVSKSRSSVAFVSVFLVIWFYVCQAGRYLIPALPFMLLIASMGIQHAGLKANFLTKSIMATGSLAILIVYLLVGIIHYRYSYLLLTGRWSWDEYLLKLERTAGIAHWVNRNLPANSKILLAREPRQFYFDHSLVRDIALRYRSDYDRKNLNLNEFSDFLKAEKITHILMSDPLRQDRPADKSILLSQLMMSSHVQLLEEMTSQNFRDDQYQYRLYELK